MLKERIAEDLKTAMRNQDEVRRRTLRSLRAALREKERAELAVIETYLPERLSDEELERELHEIIERTGATSQNDMGQVMGEAMERLRGRVQGRRVQQRVQEMLGG
ncbi:MAG: hypothetical protein BRD46_06055 [Bacteroidetes bacterium QS_8_68_15]|nr:MAG: hypothetical protein BRD46_06055 [Bacteroidetes bacterium QS_8_68_15]